MIYYNPLTWLPPSRRQTARPESSTWFSHFLFFFTIMIIMTMTMTMTVVDDDCLIQSPVELSSWTNGSKLRKKSWLSSTFHIILLDIIISLTFPITKKDLRLSPGWLSSLRAPCHRRPAGTGTRPHAPPSLQTSSDHWLRRQSSIISFHFCVTASSWSFTIFRLLDAEPDFNMFCRESQSCHETSLPLKT